MLQEIEEQFRRHGRVVRQEDCKIASVCRTEPVGEMGASQTSQHVDESRL
jgi:hypothetical protein